MPLHIIVDVPTYEYACQSCGHHVEVYQRFSDEPLTECGVCGGQLRKVFHPAGILFKGSGFYATDSRAARAKSSEDGGSKPTSKSSETAGSGGSDASSGTSETKSETKKPAKDTTSSGSNSAEKSA